MTYTNRYVHCGVNWVLEGCDSMHNDRCSKCDAEIRPYLSVREEGAEIVEPDFDIEGREK